MTDFTGLLNNLRARFDAEGVPCVIGGSFALAANGFIRGTKDIDVMVLTDDLLRVQRALMTPPDRYDRINEVTYHDSTTGLYVDVLPALDDAQKAVFRDARLMPLYGAERIRVLTAEGLAIMLLREATQDPRQRRRRLVDLDELARIGKLDWGYVAHWAKRMGYERAYAEVEAPGKPPL